MSETTRQTLCLICYQKFQGYDLQTQSLVIQLLTDRFKVFSKYMKWRGQADFDFHKVSFPFCKHCKLLVIKISELNQAIEESIEQINQIALSVSAKILLSSDLESAVDKLDVDDVPLIERIHTKRILQYRRQIKHRYAVSVKLGLDPLVAAASIRKPGSTNVSGIEFCEEDEADPVRKSVLSPSFATSKPEVSGQCEQDGTLIKKARIESKAEEAPSETTEAPVEKKRPRGRTKFGRNYKKREEESESVTLSGDQLVDVEADQNDNDCESNPQGSSVQVTEAEKTEIVPEMVTESPGTSQKKNTPIRRSIKLKRVPKPKPPPLRIKWEETVLKNLSVGQGLLEMLRQSKVHEILIDDDEPYCEEKQGGENQTEDDNRIQNNDYGENLGGLIRGSGNSGSESSDESQQQQFPCVFDDDLNGTTESESDRDEPRFTSNYVTNESPLPAVFNSKSLATSEEVSTNQPEHIELNRCNNISDEVILECVANQVKSSETASKEFTCLVTTSESISVESSTNKLQYTDEIKGECLASFCKVGDETSRESNGFETRSDHGTVEESEKSLTDSDFCEVVHETINSNRCVMGVNGFKCETCKVACTGTCRSDRQQTTSDFINSGGVTVVNNEQDIFIDSVNDAIRCSLHIANQSITNSQQAVCSTSGVDAPVQPKTKGRLRRQRRKSDHCNRRIISKESLANHQRSPCGKSESQESEITGNEDTQGTQLFYNSYPYEIVDGRYHCGSCSLTYKGMKFLEHHIRNVHIGLQIHICSICDTRFRQLGQLIRHQRTHGQQQLPTVANNSHTENLSYQPEVGRMEEVQTFEEPSYDEEVFREEVVEIQPEPYEPELPQCVSEEGVSVENPLELNASQVHLDTDFSEISENIEGNQNDKASQADFGPEDEDVSPGPADLYDNVTPYPILFQIEPEPLDEGVDAFVNSLVAKYYVLEEI